MKLIKKVVISIGVIAFALLLAYGGSSDDFVGTALKSIWKSKD